ncbi:hypothetical protein PGT21_001258 [Puccinia graminis f. sp. tritici]|uniref:Uncharacterized protein n=1 Tax=Puccinia graminis f. sp. tritici TaxID=56615 RepID=A0A5B0MV69_PUCGR|nr:hypothetical protein PGT21_001258 [Puccinia graminis f. sp. tritici]KAA1079928.1 hypothetical protein PGTUg99_005762 [Puccinia graminis f. sp. tritici]
MLSIMLNGKASSRGMIYILFIGMIITLSINLSSAITCVKSFQPRGDGKVVCDTGIYTHTCSLNNCYVLVPTNPASEPGAIAFEGCNRADGSGAVATVYVQYPPSCS